MPKRLTVQLPIEQEVYAQFKTYAKQMGFDSPQAYIRFWIAGELTQKQSPIDLSSEKMQAIRYIELVLATSPGNFLTMQHAIQYLLRQLYNSNTRIALKQMLTRQQG